MNNNNETELSAQVLSHPALLFLHYRLEQILGIRATCDSLIQLNEYIENYCGSSFVESPAAYEYLLTSREQIHNITKYITVNETYFFRESAHFELLSNMLPQLIKINRPLRICSAATSVGCEAYSLAMLFDYYSRNRQPFDFSIDAFDVNSEAIETAKNARYTANSLRNDGSGWKYILDIYLKQENDEYAVTQNIRSKVNFFPHNIIRGLDKQYDIIFFRNSLIYFTPRNRFTVINILSESLVNGGLLFLGTSETSSIKHPLLAEKYSSNVFYFQKTSFAADTSFGAINAYKTQQESKSSAINVKKPKTRPEKQINDAPSSVTPELSVNCAEITAIMETDEGKPNAEKVYEFFLGNEKDCAAANTVSGSELAASVFYYLSHQDLTRADALLSCFEKTNSCVFAKFLRGEYYFLRDNTEEAQKYFNEAAVKNRFFWPAFYRMTALASQENRTSYEYKIKKAIDSINLSQKAGNSKEFKYECFMGGFSPDYFIRILEKKLT
ncbi:MAG: chemotaxis protein CheR [Treponema sp.]|jgi:chemotaxis protein methyltransferase CheR|nr:chemotaxis protein CheR [Treponema sp.]